MQSQPGTPDDASAIAAIYNQGSEDRIATFVVDRHLGNQRQAPADS
jgi:hypothetical protein